MAAAENFRVDGFIVSFFLLAEPLFGSQLAQ
jgi:hypothetical protein